MFRKICLCTTTYFVILSKQKPLSLVACIKLIIMNHNLNHLPSNYEEVSWLFDSLDGEKQAEWKEVLANEIGNLYKQSGEVKAFIGMSAK